MTRSKGGSKKKKDSGPKTIHGAANNGDIEALDAFLEADASALESVNRDGWTPLMTAAFGGEDEVVTHLLDKYNANVKAVCKDKCTALHYASAQGEVECIRLLAAKGASLTCSDRDGDTPLSVAQDSKTKKFIQGLIDAAEV